MSQPPVQLEQRTGMRYTGSLYVATAMLSGAGLLGKSGLIAHLAHVPAWMVALVLAAGLCVPLGWRMAVRIRYLLAPLVILAILIASLFVFPRMEALHRTGRGTDQPDCVIVAAHHVMTGTWPYHRSEMWSGNPMSCGPGWVAMQSPSIVAIGYSGSVILLWAISLGLLTASIGWSATAALLSLVCLSPAFWLAVCDGSDFLTFGIAAAALIAAMRRFHASPPARIAMACVAGLLAQFRVATLLLPAFLKTWLGPKTAFFTVLGSLFVEAGCILWNAPSFVADGPLHIAVKLTDHHIFSTQPLLASLELALPVLAAASLVIFFLPKLRQMTGLVGYFALIFIVPSLLDFLKKKHLYGSYTNMLQYWEGALWLCACLPLFALLLVGSGRAEQPEDAMALRENI